eukprot:TRINITY_DN9770_c0_g1_i1.p1 TRINITY_DN9770_c0_g1~~TRINITY_DN9770_c0_g1_i1.p1  ORF type:complete len:72 (-),score=6.48 TRINITY_DN9770_c0_g1_i1:61-276(-)
MFYGNLCHKETVLVSLSGFFPELCGSQKNNNNGVCCQNGEFLTYTRAILVCFFTPSLIGRTGHNFRGWEVS